MSNLKTVADLVLEAISKAHMPIQESQISAIVREVLESMPRDLDSTCPDHSDGRHVFDFDGHCFGQTCDAYDPSRNYERNQT